MLPPGFQCKTVHVDLITNNYNDMFTYLLEGKKECKEDGLKKRLLQCVTTSMPTSKYQIHAHPSSQYERPRTLLSSCTSYLVCLFKRAHINDGLYRKYSAYVEGMNTF